MKKMITLAISLVAVSPLNAANREHPQSPKTALVRMYLSLAGQYKLTGTVSHQEPPKSPAVPNTSVKK